MVVHNWNSSYLGGNARNHSPRLAQAKNIGLYLKNNYSKKELRVWLK
jgi:hypothetical protein